MTFGLILEPISESGFPPGYFYAHIPALGLTTQGEGIEGARAAAADLARLWLEEKAAQGEAMPDTSAVLFSTVDVPARAVG